MAALPRLPPESGRGRQTFGVFTILGVCADNTRGSESLSHRHPEGFADDGKEPRSVHGRADGRGRRRIKVDNFDFSKLLVILKVTW